MKKPDMRDKVLGTLLKEVGEGASLSKVVEHLVDSGAITRASSCRYVIGCMFFERLAQGRERSAHDLEQEIAAETGMSDRNIRHLRTPQRVRKK